MKCKIEALNHLFFLLISPYIYSFTLLNFIEVVIITAIGFIQCLVDNDQEIKNVNSTIRLNAIRRYASW